MEVSLIACYRDPDGVVGRSAAMCYGGSNYVKALATALEGHHESVTEHAQFTFEIKGVSTCLLAQLTRHRFFSFSVKSERYCGASRERVIPLSIRKDAYVNQMVEDLFGHIDAVYELALRENIPKEDIRYIMPKATTYDLIASANARELNHFFELRCCNRAQWEIRELAENMLACVKTVAPLTFIHSGAFCKRWGFCPEGKKGCGKYPAICDEMLPDSEFEKNYIIHCLTQLREAVNE